MSAEPSQQQVRASRPASKLTAVWMPDRCDEQVRDAVAREVVGVLLGQPQQSSSAPRVTVSAALEPARAPQPLGFRPDAGPTPVQRLYAAVGKVGLAAKLRSGVPSVAAAAAGVAVPGRTLHPGRSRVQNRKPDNSAEREACSKQPSPGSPPMPDVQPPFPSKLPGSAAADTAALSTPAAPPPSAADDPAAQPQPAPTRVIRRRPGRGGRKPNASAHNEFSAVQNLVDQHGAPTWSRRHKGVQMHFWELDASRPGLTFMRLSSQEVKKGETIGSQYRTVQAACEQLGLRPGFLLASVNNSGRVPYEQRQDFAEIMKLVEAGQLQWIAARGQDRLARRTAAGSRFLEQLQAREVDLYLATLGRKVDWDRDELLLDVTSMADSHAAKAIVQNTSNAIISQFPAEGRGWPGAIRFGFRRNPATREVEVDPEQWPYVKQIHYGYGQLDPDNHRRRGLRPLRQQLADQGCDLSESALRNILRDPRYVTGLYTVQIRGVRSVQKAIPLPDPIPEEIFQRNQQLMATNRGRNSATPLGQFCLNYVPMFHARCMHLNPDGIYNAYQLRGSITPTTKQLRYSHRPVPACCRRYAIPAAQLERVVLSELRRLAADPHIQQAWASARHADSTPDNAGFSNAEQAALQAKLDAVAAQIEQLQQAMVADAENGGTIDPQAFTITLGPLRQRHDELQRQQRARQHQHAEQQAAAAQRLHSRTDAPDLLHTLHQVLTDHVPDDENARVRRACAVQACLSKIVLQDTPDGVQVQLHGPLVPDNAPPLPIGPLHDAQAQLREAREAADRRPATDTATPKEHTAPEDDNGDKENDGASVHQADTYRTLAKTLFLPGAPKRNPPRVPARIRSSEVWDPEPGEGPAWVSPWLLALPVPPRSRVWTVESAREALRGPAASWQPYRAGEFGPVSYRNAHRKAGRPPAWPLPDQLVRLAARENMTVMDILAPLLASSDEDDAGSAAAIAHLAFCNGAGRRP